MVVRHGDKAFFPTITLTAEPPAELRYLPGVAQRYQQLVVVSGVPETRNVTYTTIGEISYLLRRAGFPGLIRLFKQLMPAEAQKAPQRHVRYNFMARPEDVNIEKTPEPPTPKSTDAQAQKPASSAPAAAASQTKEPKTDTPAEEQPKPKPRRRKKPAPTVPVDAASQTEEPKTNTPAEEKPKPKPRRRKKPTPPTPNPAAAVPQTEEPVTA